MAIKMMKFITLDTVTEKTTLSISAIDEMESRAEFPKRRIIRGENEVWFEAEVDDWMLNQPTNQTKHKVLDNMVSSKNLVIKQTETPKQVNDLNDEQQIINKIYEQETKHADKLNKIKRQLFATYLSISEIIKITGQSRNTIYKKMELNKFDKQYFPKYHLIPGYNNERGWKVHEIWEWASTKERKKQKQKLLEILSSY